MPTADSLAAMLKAKSTLIKPITPVIPKAIAKPVVDPSAARYAAMEAQERARLAAAKAAPDDQIGRRIAISQPITTNTAPNKGIPKDDVVGRRMVIGEPITTDTATDKYGIKALPGDQLDRRIALGEPITTDTATDKYGTVTKPVVTKPPITTVVDDNKKDDDTPVTFVPPVVTPIPPPGTEKEVFENPILTADPPGGRADSPVVSATTPEIKTATPDIITIDQETLPAELMTALIFESIGGQELLSLSRHDLITGGNLEYQPIRNMAIINAEYNSGNIIFMPDSASAYLRNFPINWDSHTIESFSDLDSSHIGIDSTKNELFLIVTDMKPGEQIEVETLKSVTSYDYTKF